MMSVINPAGPVGFLLLMLDARRLRAREERGASAVEWVIIAAIVVAICIGVAAILKTALEGKATDIGNDIQNQ
jgi:Flp pilus assembly pilin Flp